MDGVSSPRKRTPLLSSPKISAVTNPSLSGSREMNEEGHPFEQKKPMTKNFMSPTISAASKASVPRKTILAERNEISSSCESHPHQKVSNLGSKTNSLNSISHRSGNLLISSCNYASESEDDQENNFSVESSYKPYDPVTNYLAPRPKYLRYQPSRRRGVIPRQEDLTRYGTEDAGFKRRVSLDFEKSNDIEGPLQQAQDSSNQLGEHNPKEEDDDGVSVALDSEKSNDIEGPLQQAQDSSNQLGEHNPKEEDDDRVSVEGDDDEEMEDNVDRQWGFKGLFKVLLLFVVLLLAGSDLSSTKSMVNSDTCNIIRKNMFEAVFHEIYGNGSVYEDHPDYSPNGMLELTQGVETNSELQSVKFDDDTEDLLNVETDEMDNTTGPLEEPSAADIDNDQESTEFEVTQSIHGDEEEDTMSTVAGEVTHTNELDEEVVEGSDEQMQRDQALDSTDSNQENLEPFNLEVVLDDISSTNAQGAHSDDKFEQAEADPNVEQVERISQETDGEEGLSETEKCAEEVDTEFETSNIEGEIESDPVEQETGLNKTVIIIGVSAASVLLASLVIIYVSRKPRASIESPRPAAILSPVIARVERDILEGKTETSVKVSSLHKPLLDDPSENLGNSVIERTTGISTIQASSSLFGPKKEASQEISHVSAPAVELLGEMVVEVSSSLRSCVRKNNIIEAEGSNTSSKGKAAISHSALPPPAEPSVVDLTASDSSPSYGSFTAEKKIIKKKVLKEGEEVKKVVLTTPVRRSSRIRDRGVMSP